ncbi:MAG: fumarylacetoacetate hydrolase [Blastopirellula sp.]|nr:MAG: fumarylacetoacetate hydrolase [Blastopirellula sp.]
MRLISYSNASGTGIAAKVGENYVDLNQADPQIPTCMKKFLELGADGLKLAQAAIESGSSLDSSEIKILPPIPAPQKIICIGLNYADHAAETGATVGDEPVVFNKFPSTLRADGEPIELPPVSNEVDYEAELVVIIGKQGKNIPLEDAMSHVAGYACGHDVSARDWQKGKPGKQWLLGKTFDSFAPLGAELVTADEIDDPHNLRIQCRINGETMQDSSTSQLIFKVDQLITYLSQICTLLPGDLIYTGTPPGVGMARKPPVFLKPGDTVEVEIEKIGVLTNPVIAGS